MQRSSTRPGRSGVASGEVLPWGAVDLNCEAPCWARNNKKLLTGKRVFRQTAMETIAVCRKLDHGAVNSARRNLNSKRLARHITPCMATWSRFLCASAKPKRSPPCG